MDYLLYLNIFAGRSFNDLSQYIVFPWVIADYTSSTLDLNDPATFRDLSKPIGCLSSHRQQRVEQNYQHMCSELQQIEEEGHFGETDGTKSGRNPILSTQVAYHHGEHFSNEAIVVHYLIRIQPYTKLALQLQDQSFDVPDSIFHSILSSRNSSYKYDCKELIPKFFQPYATSSFLCNSQLLDMGCLQDGTPIGDVKLPPWASSPKDFAEKNRQALESEFVSRSLHLWIDLMFGYRQRGPDATGSLNLFHSFSYVENVDTLADPKLAKLVEDHQRHFGTSPGQLFTKPHPSRWGTSPQAQSEVGRTTQGYGVGPAYPDKEHTSSAVVSVETTARKNDNEEVDPKAGACSPGRASRAADLKKKLWQRLATKEKLFSTLARGGRMALTKAGALFPEKTMKS